MFDIHYLDLMRRNLVSVEPDQKVKAGVSDDSAQVLAYGNTVEECIYILCFL